MLLTMHRMLLTMHHLKQLGRQFEKSIERKIPFSHWQTKAEQFSEMYSANEIFKLNKALSSSLPFFSLSLLFLSLFLSLSFFLSLSLAQLHIHSNKTEVVE